MRRKEKVMELLRQGREQELADLVAADRTALRPLLGRLWDPRDEIRRRAAAAVGSAAASHPDLGLEIIRRLVWALNDESATNGVYGIPALGEIGRRDPRLLEPFLAGLAAQAWDPGLRPEILRAMTVIAGTAPGLVRPHLDELARFVDVEQPEEAVLFERLAAAVKKGPVDEV
jgi:hypothetical protein